MGKQLGISAFESIDSSNGLRCGFELLVLTLCPAAQFLVKMK